MKSFVFIIFLAACNVHCNMTSTGRQELKSRVYLELAMQMISQAMYHFPNSTDNTKAELKKAADCADILKMGHKKSGIYEIWPLRGLTEGKSLYVYCDMDTSGGGWTVIQRRGIVFNNLKDYFYKNWENYKNGFGRIEEDFWLGNDKIFVLTNQKMYSVRFDLKDLEHNKKYALYDKFWIDGDINKYTLHISGYSGDAGDSMEYHNGQKFTTFDQDNDNNSGNCAVIHKGAWWYKSCYHANLNGHSHKEKYSGNGRTGWDTWKYESLAWTEIKIRPKNFKTVYSSK